MTISEELDYGQAIIDGLIAYGPTATESQVAELQRSYPNAQTDMWAKADLLQVVEQHYFDDENYYWLKKLLTKKPIRSLSGITSVTVLTKPYPCPGKCVFCPVDVRMPKSYIATEPGAQRAGMLGFDPYQQVDARLRSYQATGHPIGKIELIVLGGSWSAYPEEYQVWFIKRLFDALNDFGIDNNEVSTAYETDWDERIGKDETYNAHINASRFVRDPYDETATFDELFVVQQRNETAKYRCVGLSLETRPDLIDDDECLRLRKLGATKIQIGIQSLDDAVLKANKRGHDIAKTSHAFELLRSFGFKIHAHWMPNLYGSSPSADIEDYQRVFAMEAIRPDELKVYPTVLIQDTELEELAAAGKWEAYEEDDLNNVLAFVLTNTPEYCRLTRIIRDIPSFEILAGNKKGNLRQIVEQLVPITDMSDIRAREIKDTIIDDEAFTLDALTYETTSTTETFLQFVRPDDRKLAGFLRLSLPKETNAAISLVPELEGAAIIREVHVYGQSLDVGASQPATQHSGLGRELIAKALDIAAAQGFEKVAVISAVGTRPYYAKQGFVREGLYQTIDLFDK